MKEGTHMKAILSLLVIFGTVGAFAQSADMRIDALMRQEMKHNREVKDQQQCAKHTLECQMRENLKSEIASLTASRDKAQNAFEFYSNKANRICLNTEVKKAEFAAFDEIVKFRNSTPCDKIVEFTNNNEAQALLSRAATVDAYRRALDAKIAEKTAQKAAVEQVMYQDQE
jgi:hypothetical protein